MKASESICEKYDWVGAEACRIIFCVSPVKFDFDKQSTSESPVKIHLDLETMRVIRHCPDGKPIPDQRQLFAHLIFLLYQKLVYVFNKNETKLALNWETIPAPAVEDTMVTFTIPN